MSTSTTAIIAVMAAQRKRLVQHFVEASAFSPESAISEDSLPPAGFRLVPKLRAQGAILAAPDGRIYLDRARWDSISQARQARAKVLLIIVVVAALCFLALTYFKAAA